MTVMLGKYRLEVLTSDGWKIVYEGDDAGAQMKATLKACLGGETTRATSIGSSGVREL